MVFRRSSIFSESVHMAGPIPLTTAREHCALCCRPCMQVWQPLWPTTSHCRPRSLTCLPHMQDGHPLRPTQPACPCIIARSCLWRGRTGGIAPPPKKKGSVSYSSSLPVFFGAHRRCGFLRHSNLATSHSIHLQRHTKFPWSPSNSGRFTASRLSW